MICPICGREVKKSARRCPNCGSLLKGQSVPRISVYLCALCVVAALAGGVCIGVFLQNRQAPEPTEPTEPIILHDGFVPYNHYIEIGTRDCPDEPGTLNLLFDDRILETDVPFGKDHLIMEVYHSLDGGTCAFIDRQSTLYVIRDDQVRKIVDHVQGVQLSNNGEGLLYSVRSDPDGFQCSLFLYTWADDSHRLLAENAPLSSYAISPDGKTAVFIHLDTIRTLHYFDGNKVEKLGKVFGEVIGISNNRSYIYLHSRQDEIVYCITPTGTHTHPAFNYLYQFNADHTQLLYRTPLGNTYICGIDEGHFSDAAVSLVLPTNRPDIYHTTMPVYDLYNKVYSGSRDLYFITREGNRLIGEDVSVFYYDGTQDTLLYHDAGAVRRYTLGELPDFNYLFSADKDSPCYFTSDGNYLYCIHDGQLMRYTLGVQSMSSPSFPISNQLKTGYGEYNIDQVFALGQGDILYYIEGSTLYARTGVTPPVPLSESIEYLRSTPAGQVYAMDKDLQVYLVEEHTLIPVPLTPYRNKIHWA